MNRPTSKTPYEIRLELLQLAFEMLVKKHEAAAVETHIGVRVLTAPTTEEIIAEADKMNNFVSKANSH